MSHDHTRRHVTVSLDNPAPASSSPVCCRSPPTRRTPSNQPRFIFHARLPHDRPITDCFVTSASEVMSSSASVCLFVSGITQKLHNRFSQSSVERRHVGYGNKKTTHNWITLASVFIFSYSLTTDEVDAQFATIRNRKASLKFLSKL